MSNKNIENTLTPPMENSTGAEIDPVVGKAVDSVEGVENG